MKTLARDGVEQQESDEMENQCYLFSEGASSTSVNTSAVCCCLCRDGMFVCTKRDKQYTATATPERRHTFSLDKMPLSK